LFNQLQVPHLVCITVAPTSVIRVVSYPGTLALLAVLSPSAPMFNEVLSTTLLPLMSRM